MGESVVECEDVRKLEVAEGVDLTVAVANLRGPLDGVKVKVTDKSGKLQDAPSTAKFKNLAVGDCNIEVELTREQQAIYLPVTYKAPIVKGTPASVVLKLPTVALDVTPVLKTDRTRAVLEGPEKKAAPVKVDLQIQFGNKDALKDLQYVLTRSRAEVDVFTDEECKSALVFEGNKAKLDAIAANLVTGKFVSLWARPRDKQGFSLTLEVAKGGLVAEVKGKPGAPAKVDFKRAFEFLEGPSRWLQLIDSFESVQEIKASLNRIRSLAALADMRADEFANFAIKRLFIRKGVLEQPVVIKIDGKQVTLKHPLSEGKLPLLYSDFIVDRSGPKFLGALDADVAVEALMYKDACISTKLADLKAHNMAPSFDPNLIQSVRDMAERRVEALRAAKPSDYPELTDSEIEAATSVFELKHMAQRKLSDFDLTARETETLSRAIAAELLQSCGQLPTALIMEIGRIAWSLGGPIDVVKVQAAKKEGGNDGQKCAAAYASRCKGVEYTPQKKYKHGKYKGTGYYHILIDEVGVIACRLLEDSMPDVDAYYGLGVPYMGPQVEEKGGVFAREKNVKEPEEEDRFEIGDIITDETSHYGTVFSHNLNIKDALAKLKAAGVAWSFDSFDKSKNLRENCRALLAKSGKADIAKAYTDRESFIDTVLMFEQVSKKEAQAQLFKAEFLGGATQKIKDKAAGKLMGNVSDVSQFLYGADIASRVAKKDGNRPLTQRLEALKEVVKLSCLIAFPRWSVFARNLDQATDTAGAIAAQDFANSINERSYAHKKVPLDQVDTEAPRVHVEWAGIDASIAQQRLDDFAGEMEPIWSFIHQQTKHFQNMDALIGAVRAKGDRSAARKAVRDELARILPKLPNLAAQIEGQEQTLLDALAQQADESAVFLNTRAPEDQP